MGGRSGSVSGVFLRNCQMRNVHLLIKIKLRIICLTLDHEDGGPNWRNFEHLAQGFRRENHGVLAEALKRQGADWGCSKC